MAIPNIAFTIAPKFDQTASKGLKEQSKIIREQKKDITELGKTQSRIAKDLARDVKLVGNEWKVVGSSIKDSMSTAHREVGRFGQAVDGLAKKIISLKGLIIGGAVGGAAVLGAKSIFEAGTAAVAAKGRARRMFGTDAAFGENAGGLIARAELAAKRAGLDDDTALRGLMGIGEAVSETQKGDRFRGKKLTEKGAQDVRKQTFEFGAKLFERIATMAPELSPDDIGAALREGGSGPEGTKRFAAAMGLSPVFARQVREANSKGKLAELLGADRAKKFGVKSGEVAGQGTVLDILLQRGGITDEAAAAKRKQFDHQIKSIGGTLQRSIGDIGERAINKLNESLGKGSSLAERFEKFMASDKAKKALDAVAGVVERLVQGVVRFVEQIPQIVKFLEQHKTELMFIGGGIAGAKVLGGVASTVGSAKTVLGAGKSVIELVAGQKPIPVYVVGGSGLGGSGGGVPGIGAGASKLQKAGALLGAGVLGYEAGTLIDEKLGLSDKLSAKLYSGFGSKEIDDAKVNAGTRGHRAMLDRIQAERDAKVKELEAKGLSHGSAVFLADHPGGTMSGPKAAIEGATTDVPINVTLTLDGQVLSKVVTKHQAKQVKAHTANGVAPTGR